MNLYELKLIKGGRGVFKISVVKDGAVEGDTVLFNKEIPENEVLVFNNEEKQIFYSIVMRPNKMIPRKNINGSPANVFYTKETVEEAAINYWRNKGNIETNLNHSEETNAQGIFPFESWIVRDPETDKSKDLGLQTFAGDWVAGYKVDSPELWNDYIKTGKLDGLSIEAMHHKYELIPNIKMEKQEKKKSFLDELMELVSMKKEIDSKVPVAKHAEHEDPKDKTPEEIKEEAIVKAKEEDEAAAMKAKQAADDMPDDKKADAPAADAPAADAEPTDKEKVYLEQIATLEKEIADLKAKQVESDTALETMKKQTPAAKKISNLPPAEKSVPYEQMSNFQKAKFNRENSRY
tara:strand:+ start:7632 stop:8678 length:1047 start_codon:yes stop_codon:yes gene_type:complete